MKPTTERIGEWIQTYTGRAFYPLDPHPEDVDIEDIAHALANLCRFGGHCRQFYSVAEHSISVSLIVPPEYALCGLLHDAAEAFCADVPRPIKRMLGPAYKNIEIAIWTAIAARFGISPEVPKCIHDADNSCLFAEKAVLLGPEPHPWGGECSPAPILIAGFSPAKAKELFLSRFVALGGK